MLAIPAIDLRDAHCVQLVGGDYEQEAVRLDDPVQVARRWIAAGFSRLHVEDPAWLEERASQHPGRIILAADVRDRVVVTKGWSASSKRHIRDVIGALAGVPLGGLLVTAVHREGKMEGTDLPLMEEVADESPWPVIASGGIATMQDLRNLEDRGISAAVLGMALYTEALDPRVVAEEFGT